MKRLITILAAVFTLATGAGAMSYEQARDQALFLTDKMAYELNLTEEQYDAAYEINLDYLMSVNSPDDLYEAYWRQRNLDLSYILLDWQYRAFCAATYFYRPLYWTDGIWHFAVYSRYPHRHYLYFGRPNIYITYRGGHSWHHNGGRSWYKGRTFHHGNTAKWHGMKDRYDRGDYRKNPTRGHGNFSGLRGNTGNKGTANRPQRPKNDNNNRRGTFNGNRNGQRTNRESSTRTTAQPGNGSKRGFNFSGNRRPGNSGTQRTPSNTFTPKGNGSRPSVNRGTGSRPSVSTSRPSRGTSGTSSRGGGSNRGGSFGGKR